MSKSAYVNGTVVPSNWVNNVFGGGSKHSWAASTAYSIGQLINVSDDIYRCIVAGTSDSSAPSWPGSPTVREQVTDNTVTWEYFEGHLHDGLDADGSAPKVLLTSGAEVTGLLPAANINIESGTFGAKVTNTYLASEATFDIDWIKFGSFVALILPGLSENAAANDELRIAPATSFPSAIVAPSGEGRTVHMVAENELCLVPAVIGIGDSTSTPWIVRIANVVTPTTVEFVQYDYQGFTSSGIKGWTQQTLIYTV